MTQPATNEHRQKVEQLTALAFGEGAVEVGDLVDVNQGRGAFSVVLRASLEPVVATPGFALPRSVVAKFPTDGPNGRAAITTGACGREALAYRELLTTAEIETPRVYVVDEPGDGSVNLLLEDLTAHRAVDQVDGLHATDAVTIAETLARFHSHWRNHARLGTLPVRRNTIAGLPMDRLQTGLQHLTTAWSDEIGPAERDQFAALLNVADGLIQRFDELAPTLCHGDPRADNVVFDNADRVVFFDWQQIAVQFGEADLAWLAATSIDAATRRTIDHDLLAAYGGDWDRYRLGMALPGMAVLLLAQRDLPTERTRRFVAASLQRIATAIGDLDVAALG